MIKRVLAVSALGAVGVLGMTALPAGASTRGAFINLRSKGGVLSFNPNKEKLAEVTGDCTITNFEFNITNKTSKTQNIYYGSTLFSSLPPGGDVFGCAGGTGKSVFTVPGTSAKLKIVTTA
jgi:hypothetical protein